LLSLKGENPLLAAGFCFFIRLYLNVFYRKLMITTIFPFC